MNRQEANRTGTFARGVERADSEPVVQDTQDRDEESIEVNDEELKTQNSKLKTALSYLTIVSRLVLGGIFLLAGLSKLGDVKGLLDSINDYNIVLPSWLPNLMANGLPPLEIAVGLFLLFGLFTRIAATVAGGLMLMFLYALVQAMVRGFGNQISCGCFATGPNANSIGAAIMSALGPVGTFLGSEKAGPESIIRDVLFLLMAVHLVFVPTIFSLDNWRSRGRNQVVEENY